MADKRPAEDDKNGHEGNGANGDGPDVKKAKPVSFNGILEDRPFIYHLGEDKSSKT